MKFNDLTGRQFGHLTVIERTNEKTKWGDVCWLCRCDCGATTIRSSHKLNSGNTKSCGADAHRRTPSSYIINGDIVEVTCSGGEKFIVDYNDLDIVKDKNWRVSAWNGYIFTKIKGKSQFLHRLIMNAQKYDIVDHKSRDIFDNRKSNLRFCVPHENSANRAADRDNKSGYKGVSYSKTARRNKSKIYACGKDFFLGYFTSDVVAAQAYNIAAKILHRNFAVLNDVPPPTRELEVDITKRVNRLLNTGGFIMPESEVQEEC